MASVFRRRILRGLMVFMFAVAALVGCYTVSLLVESFNGQGSPAGNVLLFALGLTLAVLSFGAFIVGFVNWKLSRPSPGNKNG